MAKRDNLDWLDVDTTQLSKPLKAAYVAYKAKAKEASTLREEFESLFSLTARKANALEADKALLFSHKWGKLSVAKIENTLTSDKPAKKGTFSF